MSPRTHPDLEFPARADLGNESCVLVAFFKPKLCLVCLLAGCAAAAGASRGPGRPGEAETTVRAPLLCSFPQFFAWEASSQPNESFRATLFRKILSLLNAKQTTAHCCTGFLAGCVGASVPYWAPAHGTSTGDCWLAARDCWRSSGTPQDRAG